LVKNALQQYIKTMLKPVSNRKSVLACLADCPADNHAHQLAQFLYETLAPIKDITFRIQQLQVTNAPLRRLHLKTERCSKRILFRYPQKMNL